MKQPIELKAAELAEVFEMTARRVQQLVNLPEFKGCKMRRGVYDLIAFCRSYTQYLKNLGQENQKQDIDPRYEMARKNRAAADKLELENEELRKLLIRVQDVVELISNVQVIYNDQFESFRGRLSTKLVTLTGQESTEIVVLLEKEIDFARQSTVDVLQKYKEQIQKEQKNK